MTDEKAENQLPPANTSAPAPGVGEQTRQLLDSVPDYAIFLLSPDGVIESWNAGGQQLKGYTAAEVVGRHCRMFYLPEDVAQRKPEIELEIAAREGRFEGEGPRRRKDGTRFLAHAIITAVRDPAGRLTGFTKVTRDLTRSRLVEERLRQSDERFRVLVEGVKDYAIFMLDAHGHVVTWNIGAEHINGYRAEEIIGQHFSRFYPEAEVLAGKCDFELALAARDGRFEEEGWRIRKDGSQFWANVVITALRDASGTLVGYAKVTRDLTERRKLEQERLRVVQANEAIRLRDEFISIASHELKTPLTTVQLQLQSLRQALGADDKARGKADRAIRSGHRLAELIDSLLDVSLIAAGQFELDRHTVDLGDLVRDVVERHREAAEKAHSDLHLDIPGPLAGSWDRARLEQVVHNLITNAIKYGAGGRIDIALSRSEGRAVIEVKDRGPGIPEAALPRLFTQFERASSPRHYGGLGLGLFVARQIVNAHGGEVTARNRPEGGAHLRVELPIVAELRAVSGLGAT